MGEVYLAQDTKLERTIAYDVLEITRKTLTLASPVINASVMPSAK